MSQKEHSVVSYITVMHTAQAADKIYSNDDFDDYTLLGGFFDPKNDDRLGWAKAGDAGGGSAGFYRYNRGAKQFILCFRGSAGSKDFTVDDVQIVRNISVDRVSDCIAYAKRVQAQNPGSFILVAGHSLGGFLAQVVGVECDMPFISYNAPGAGAYLSRTMRYRKFDRGVNFRINWDPVSRGVGHHVGPLITLPHYGWKIWDAHMGVAYLQSVERSAFKDNAAMAFITRQNMYR